MASVLCDHGLPRLASPCLLELRHVLDDAVHAVMAWRMRIGGDLHAQIFGTLLLTPYPAEAQKEALLWREAINLLAFFSGFILSNQALQSGKGNTRAAIVGGVLAQREPSVQFHVVDSDEVRILIGHAADAFLKLFS